MFGKKLTVSDLTNEDIAALLHADQRRKANRKAGLVAYTVLWLYGRRLQKVAKHRATNAHQLFPGACCR